MRAPDKNRFLNAARHMETEQIAFQENDPDMMHVNRILEKDFSLSLHSFDLPAADYVELNRRMGNDMVFFSHVWRLGRKETTDADGRIHYIDGIMKTRDTLKDIWHPDLDSVGHRLERLVNAVENTGFGITCFNQNAQSVVSRAIGFEDYWMSIIDEPQFVHDFQNLVQKYCIEELRLYLKYPVDNIRIGFSVGSKSGAMCSKEMLEEFAYPHLAQQVEMAKDAGKIATLHVDGNVSEMIGDFIDMGVDILNPIEPSDVQSIYELKDKYGERIAFHGNIDTAGVLLNGTTQDVMDEVNEHIEKLAVGGGYIVGSSHDLHQMVPIENFYAMRDATHQYNYKIN